MHPTTPLVITGLPGSGTTVAAMMAMAMGWTGYDRQHCEDPDVAATNRLLVDGGHLNHQATTHLLRGFDFPWLIKDPQFCLTLSRWMPCLSSWKPCLLVCRRNRVPVGYANRRCRLLR